MVFRDGVRAPETVEWTREEILREARKAATSVTAEATKEVLLSHNQGTLRARDIRRLLIDLLEGDPELLVRKHSILVKLPPLTAIVMHDRCFVFIPDGADSLLGVLRKNLSSAPEAEQQDGEITHDFLPFELKAIEAILVTVVTEIRKDFKDLSLAVKSVLKGVKGSTQSGGLEKLHQEKNKSSRFLLRLRGIRKAISTLLDTDEDMALMNLTKIHREPQRYSDASSQEWRYDHDEVELLLEAYLHEVEAVLNQATFQQSEIEAYEGLGTNNACVMCTCDRME